MSDPRTGWFSGFDPRPFGIALIAGSVVMVVFMAMHPSPHAHDLLEFIRELEAGAAWNAAVHGVLMASAAATFIGLLGVAWRLGAGFGTAAGMVAQACAAVAGMGAAVVNGFVEAGVLAGRANDEPGTIDKLKPLILIMRETNQTLARMDVVAACVGTMLLSLVMVRRDGWRAVGWLGIGAGAAPLVMLAVGRLPMNVHGFGLFVLLYAAWCAAAGVRLLRPPGGPAHHAAA